MTEKKSIAIIGSGIAGLGCAYHLRDHYRLTVFDGNSYAGGHTNTIDVDGLSFDTGFMVFNYETYPLLTALFKELGVPVKKRI
jgi:Predicted NAD/FAD-binding protein